MKRLFTLLLIIFTLILLENCSISRKAQAKQQQIQKVISKARSYKGTPYKWGGNGYKGIDCSGLTFNALSAAGIKLPRIAGDQSKMGKSVELDYLKPGDLLFFSKKKGKRKIVHVGLVTEVKNNTVMFIHASSSRGVVENPFSNYYKDIFVKARRIIR